MRAADVRIAVAIPARDEAGLIGRCLDALSGQIDPGPFVVIVLANNCKDETVAIAKSRRDCEVRVVEKAFAPSYQNAGHARRAAMAAAAELGEIVLTTDADCVPDAVWVVAHRNAFAKGVDAVAGRVSGDWEELKQLPPRALEIGAVEWEYLGLIADAEALFAPKAHDPAPRHAQCCGANLGITRSMLEKVGGVPPIATGEDRALIAAVEAMGGLVRYDRAPHVIASARTSGRATGGMADALAARLSPDYRCDAQFRRADALVAEWTGQRLGMEELHGADARLRPKELAAEIARLRTLMATHG